MGVFYSKLERYALFFYITLISHIFIDPVIFAPGHDVIRMGKFRIGLMTAAIALAAWTWRKIHPVAAVLVAGVLLRFLIMDYDLISLLDVFGILMMVGLAAAVLSLKMKDWNRALSWLAWAAVPHALVSIAGVFGFYPYLWLMHHGVRPWMADENGIIHYSADTSERILAAFPPHLKNVGLGLFDQPSFTGAWLAMFAAYHLHRGRKKNYFAFIFIFLGVLATKASIPLLGVGVGVAFWLWWEHARLVKKYWVGVCCFGGAMLAALANFFPHYLEPSGREIWWRWAWRFYLERPWFGYGAGHWIETAGVVARALGIRKIDSFGHVHNEYLELIFEQGIIGWVVIFCGFWFFARALVWGLKNERKNVFFGAWAGVGLAAAAMAAGNFIFHAMPFALVALMAWLYVVKFRFIQKGKSYGN